MSHTSSSRLRNRLRHGLRHSRNPIDRLPRSSRGRLALLLSGVVATTLLLVAGGRASADRNPGTRLEQCENLTTVCDSSHPSNWITGNLGTSNSDYSEGDSVPFRATLNSLTIGASYGVNIGFESTKDGKHAYDYLTSFNRTESTAEPCVDVTCSPPNDTLPIPIDTNVSGAGVTQVGSQFISLFGGNFIDAGSNIANTGDLCATATCNIAMNPEPYVLTGGYAGSSSTSTYVYFTASAETVVLAWGGHIAAESDWGVGMGAFNIAGSPYHMNLGGLTCSPRDCNTGAKDVSISSAAVTPTTTTTTSTSSTTTSTSTSTTSTTSTTTTVPETTTTTTVPETTTTTVPETTTTTVPETTTTVVETTTTVPETTTTVVETTTTVPVTTTTVPVTTTTVPVTTTLAATTTTAASTTTVAPTTTAAPTTTTIASDLQAIFPSTTTTTPESDLLVLFPDTLPDTGGGDIDMMSIVSLVLMLLGALALGVVVFRNNRLPWE